MTIGRRGEVVGDAVHRPTKAGRTVGKDAPVCDFALVGETFVRRMS
jgi:hypothetical protein